MSKLKAAIGDDAVPGVSLGTRVGAQAAGADAADVVPAETDASMPQSMPAAGQCPLPCLLTKSERSRSVCFYGMIPLQCLIH